MQERLEVIKKKLISGGKVAFVEGAKEIQIQKFEKDNMIKLPNEYKTWLKFSDGGELYIPAGVQFYGVAHAPLIDTNYNDRPNEEYIVIGALCTGDPILFKKGTNKIMIFNREANKIEQDEIYDDFYLFLNDLDELLGIGD